jgi:Uri superfamily endonuclease
MSTPEALRELMARAAKCEQVSLRISKAYDEFLQGDFAVLGKKTTSAMVIAEYMVDYYMCLETFFLRVSQHFENHLRDERWHADLLEKMTLSIEGVRQAVICEASAADLSEIMKFRH